MCASLTCKKQAMETICRRILPLGCPKTCVLAFARTHFLSLRSFLCAIVHANDVCTVWPLRTSTHVVSPQLLPRRFKRFPSRRHGTVRFTHYTPKITNRVRGKLDINMRTEGCTEGCVGQVVHRRCRNCLYKSTERLAKINSDIEAIFQATKGIAVADGEYAALTPHEAHRTSPIVIEAAVQTYTVDSRSTLCTCTWAAISAKLPTSRPTS